MVCVMAQSRSFFLPYYDRMNLYAPMFNILGHDKLLGN